MPQTGTIRHYRCDHDPPKIRCHLEPLNASSPTAVEALKVIPPSAWLFAVVRDFECLPKVSRRLIRTACGWKRRRVADLTVRASVPNVRHHQPRFDKPIRAPQNCKFEGLWIRKLSEAVAKSVVRNRHIVKVALVVIAAPADDAADGLSPWLRVPRGRTALVAADDSEVVELLKRLLRQLSGGGGCRGTATVATAAKNSFPPVSQLT